MLNLPFGLTPRYFFICNALAQKAAATGNPPVGCLILQNGKIVARAAEATKTKQDVTCHAEMEALRKARKKLGTADLSDCLLLTTHEPCVMCGYAIRFHRISQVVFSHRVPHLGSVSSGFNILTTSEVSPNWAVPPEVAIVDF